MKFLLDTNICIYIINKKPQHVSQYFKTKLPGDICLSSITVAELSYGVEKSQSFEKNRLALQEFMLPFEILSFDAHVAEIYGNLRATLEKKGIPIDPLDLMIASVAKTHDMTLVTNNVREFKRIPELVIEDWSKERAAELS